MRAAPACRGLLHRVAPCTQRLSRVSPNLLLYTSSPFRPSSFSSSSSHFHPRAPILPFRSSSVCSVTSPSPRLGSEFAPFSSASSVALDVNLEQLKFAARLLTSDASTPEEQKAGLQILYEELSREAKALERAEAEHEEADLGPDGDGAGYALPEAVSDALCAAVERAGVAAAPSPEEREAVVEQSLARAGERGGHVHAEESLTFGRVPPHSLGVVLERIRRLGGLQVGPEGRGGCFVDLGSGDGVVCLAAAALHPFGRARGVEVCGSLHEAALALQRAAIDLGVGGEPGCLQLEHGDFRAADWSEAQVVFVNSTAFSPGLMAALAREADHLRGGAWVVTLTRPLPSDQFVLVDKVRLPANGLGLFGASSEGGAVIGAGAGAEGAMPPEDEDADGLFTFYVHQRLPRPAGEGEARADGAEAAALRDSEGQRWVRGRGLVPHLVGLLASPRLPMQALATMTIGACMRSDPTVRELVAAGLVPAVRRLLQPEGHPALQACGAMLLGEMAPHPCAQTAIIHDAEEEGEATAEPAALSPVLRRVCWHLDSDTEAVAAAMVTTLDHVASRPDGCGALAGPEAEEERLRVRLRAIQTVRALAAGEGPGAMMKRATAESAANVLEKLRIDWDA